MTCCGPAAAATTTAVGGAAAALEDTKHCSFPAPPGHKRCPPPRYVLHPSLQSKTHEFASI